MDEERIARSFLRKCSAAYEALVAHVLSLEPGGDDEETLKWLGLAATAAWIAHAGRYADERLEAVALRAGQGLVPLEPRAPRTANAPGNAHERRRVLHVATTVYGIGGHTRLIESWIQNDPASLHSLVLLDQRQEPIRAQIADLIAESGGELIVLRPDCPLLEKARQLRQAARSGYDCVVLHHHPNDVVPLVALASEDCPPVALMNHADHVFWLGVSVADAIIEFREFGARLSRERRGARQSLLLPMPLDLTPPALGRAEARARLGLKEDETMLLSIGSSYKYNPTSTHDFFRTLHKVLADNPRARLYVIGVRADEWRSFGMPRHDRIELLGIIEDPGAYVAAADLYLESFPFGSYTALFETAAQGVCPVLMYAPMSHTAISRDVPLRGLIASATDEADYVARVTALIGDPAARTRLGDAVARQIASIHGVDISRTYLEPIYERLLATAHRPEPPPAQAVAETEDDLCLAGTNRGRIKRAVLQQISNDAPTSLTVADLLRILAMSIRIGDTRLKPSHVRGWLGLFQRKLLSRRPD